MCEHLNWHNDSGENRFAARFKMPKQLQSAGVLQLPIKDESKIRGARECILVFVDISIRRNKYYQLIQ